MVESAPEIYHKYITYRRNGKAVLYITLQKALYGCMKSALLFYSKLVGDFKSRQMRLFGDNIAQFAGTLTT